MGVDLKLLPIESNSSNHAHSQTVLNVLLDEDLHDFISDIKRQYPVPESFNSYVSRDGDYSEPHYGQTTEDAYGERVNMIKAIDLVTAFKRYRHQQGNLIERNRAVLAYLEALDDDRDIALFWH